ncbi:MAG: FAD-binding oxidoreductase, partial [Nitrospinota bacterium]
MTAKPDVVIVGAGVMGCGTAYWLSKAGYRVLVVEKESIACGASGVSAAMLDAVGHGAQEGTLTDPLSELARASFKLHQELGRLLPEESGIDIGYRENPTIHVAFTPEEVTSLKAEALALQQQDASVQWLEGAPLWELEPRLNREALGGVVTPQAQVIAYRFVLALARVAEQHGMEMRHGEVVGLEKTGSR